jgi:hypothetical protein
MRQRRDSMEIWVQPVHRLLQKPTKKEERVASALEKARRAVVTDDARMVEEVKR